MRGQRHGGRRASASGEELRGSRPTSPVLPVGEVRGDGDPPALPHARALQPLVHPGDDVTLSHVGVVRVVAGVAATQAGRASQGVRGAPALAGSSEPPPAAARVTLEPGTFLPASPLQVKKANHPDPAHLHVTPGPDETDMAESLKSGSGVAASAVELQDRRD